MWNSQCGADNNMEPSMWSLERGTHLISPCNRAGCSWPKRENVMRYPEGRLLQPGRLQLAEKGIHDAVPRGSPSSNFGILQLTCHAQVPNTHCSRDHNIPPILRNHVRFQFRLTAVLLPVRFLFRFGSNGSVRAVHGSVSGHLVQITHTVCTCSWIYVYLYIDIYLPS